MIANNDLGTVDEGLYYNPESHDSAMECIAWWERYRLIFNILVGVTGLASLFTGGAFGLVSTFEIVAGILLYGLAANLTFSLGWIGELLLRHYFGSNITLRPVRSVILVAGIAFSVVITFIIARWYVIMVALSDVVWGL
jgi:hypothetical protein